ETVERNHMWDTQRRSTAEPQDCEGAAGGQDADEAQRSGEVAVLRAIMPPCGYEQHHQGPGGQDDLGEQGNRDSDRCVQVQLVHRATSAIGRSATGPPAGCRWGRTSST